MSATGTTPTTGGDLGLEDRRSGPKGHQGFRSPYDRDRARIIHSFPFRRLQAKTQVLGIGEGDFHRTRLTHSMEVAQIARGIVYQLQQSDEIENEVRELLDTDLIEAISLAHDLGHPPFGHAGEIALNTVMSDFGGFEGNGQTLRILSNLPGRGPVHGLELTRRTLLGVLKYPVPYSEAVATATPKQSGTAQPHKPPKCYLDTEAEVVAWLQEPFDPDDRELFEQTKPHKHGQRRSTFKTLDCSIMDVADDIAYGVYDFEDGLALNLITETDQEEIIDKAVNCGLDQHVEKCFRGPSWERKRGTGRIVSRLIEAVHLTETDQTFRHPLLRYKARISAAEADLLDAMQNLVRSRIMEAHQVQTLEYRGQRIVRELFSMISCDPERLLPISDRDRLDGEKASPKRVVCDYVAGMTDEYAIRFYERLRIPRRGSTFERL